MTLTTREIDIEQPYIILPVRYDAPLGLMRFIVDGEKERKFGIKLASTAPDYFVFADVKRLHGKTVKITYDCEIATNLDVLTLSTVAVESKDLYRERYRPQFHFSTRRGFTNDPNGLVFYQGEYHLFYQHQPFGTDIGFDLKFWGHAVSSDLLHWQELGPVLDPDEHGAIYSGSAVVDWHNTSDFQQGDEPPLVALYTADGRNADVERPFTQCLAYSNDRGRTWTKYDQNPVVSHMVALNRDPRVIWYEPTNSWVMALYLDQGRFAFFRSINLREWSKLSEIELTGSQDCPDLFELVVDEDEHNTRWVFWAADTRYYVGWFDGKTFIPEGQINRLHSEGTSYAAQTWSEIRTDRGNPIQISWFITPGPGMPFTNCMTVPCEMSLKTIGNQIYLCQWPIDAVNALRTEPHHFDDILLDPDHFPIFNPRERNAPARWGDWTRYPIGFIGDTIDLECSFDPGSAEQVSISIRGISVVYNAHNRRIAIEGGMACSAPAAVATIKQTEGIIHLRILLDRTTCEVFADYGATPLALGVIPVDDDHSLVVAAKGGVARFLAIDYWNMKSIWK